jgi:predicted dinucleotide-binding enzyme
MPTASVGSIAVKIAIIGAGSLGVALARKLLETGHQVKFGGGATAQEAAASLNVSADSNHAAVACAEVVVLAVPFPAVGRALDEAGPLGEAVLWSCVNAIRPDFSGLMIGFETSAAEEVARHAKSARVVAAIPPFAEALANGDLSYDEGLSPSVFLCGDDEDAKATVERLVADLGAQPVDAGPLSAARLVEPAMMLLISLAYGGLPRDVGLRLLERSTPLRH